MTANYSASQLLFMWSAVSGTALGAVYDVFRLLRLFGAGNKFAVFVQDVAFCLIWALTYLILTYNFSSGILRIYSPLTMAAGFLIWRFTVGNLLIRIASGLKNRLRALLLKLRARRGATGSAEQIVLKNRKKAEKSAKCEKNGVTIRRERTPK